MKTILSFILLSIQLAGMSLFAAEKINILFIGNSFTQRDGMYNIIKVLAEEGIHDLAFVTSAQIYPGRTLADHWEFGSQNFVRRTQLTIAEQETLLKYLRDKQAQFPDDVNYPKAVTRHTELLNDLKKPDNIFEKWDIVVLQSWKDDLSGSQSAYLDYATRFAELAIAQGGRVVFYETSPGTMNQRPLSTPPSNRNSVLQKAGMFAKLAQSFDAIVVPMSMVIYRSQTERPDFTLRYVNDMHANQRMTYLTACAFYGALFDKSPEGLTLDRIKSSVNLPGDPTRDLDGKPITMIFSDQDRLDLQRIAWEGIQDYRSEFGLVHVTDEPTKSMFRIEHRLAADSVTIISDAPLHIPVIYKIIDISGKVLLQGTLNGMESVISVAGLPKGMYFIQVSADNIHTDVFKILTY